MDRVNHGEGDGLGSIICVVGPLQVVAGEYIGSCTGVHEGVVDGEGGMVDRWTRLNGVLGVLEDEHIDLVIIPFEMRLNGFMP